MVVRQQCTRPWCINSSSLAAAVGYLAAAVGNTTARATQFLQQQLEVHVFKRFKPPEPGLSADASAQEALATQLLAAVQQCSHLAGAKGE
jgi:hypothetical protein